MDKSGVNIIIPMWQQGDDDAPVFMFGRGCPSCSSLNTSAMGVDVDGMDILKDAKSMDSQV